MKLIIGHLYADLMNIYGDMGNIIALKKRAEWRGIEVKLKVKSLKSKIKKGECDIFFFGGGQDQQQSLVASDLESSGKGKIIKEEVERGIPLLAICGGYQLLGQYYKPHNRPKLPGVGLFPAYTVAGDKRMIGNIIIDTQFGKLVGFENHSGQTYLKKTGQPLGKIIKGFGNNGGDQTEGCIYKNAVGCYMHGSLLPKNPALADWLLEKALKIKLEPLNDSLELQAHLQALMLK
ncbi:glutamine amidotransferase [Candidatus Daviesbacteria bacterium]|nr:glutamine amidotransferase [Candidatus Daviesbacteria bacterium]